MKPPASQAVSLAEIRRQIIEGLTQSGFAVTEARHLTEALASLYQQAGVLVLLDLMNPEEGQQLLEELQAMERGNQQPVLLISPAKRLPPERQLLQ